jgi:hypothetical protein
VVGEKVEVHEKPKIIQDVKLNSPIENMPAPTEDAMKMLTQLNEAKQGLLDAMRDFNRLLGNRTLKENRTIKDNELEQSVVVNLAQSAKMVEQLDLGEGILGLCILSLRQALTLRDAGNGLAYEIQKIKEKITNIENKIQTIESDIYESVEPNK